MEQSLMNALADGYNYGVYEIILNLLVALFLSILISVVYRMTHRSLSYSQSFNITLVLVGLIVSIVMMVIGGSLARAFALVGALSIIRFRTVVKDTKDTAFVFAVLAIGMAAGTSNYLLAFLGASSVVITVIILDKINFSVLSVSDFILRFNFDQHSDSSGYLECISNSTKSSNMLHLEVAGENTLTITFDIKLKDEISPNEFIKLLSVINGVSEITFIAANNDLDY